MKKAQNNSYTESSDDEKSYKWTEGKIYKWVKQPGLDNNGCEIYRRKSTKPGRYEFKYVRPEPSESIRRMPEPSEFIRFNSGSRGKSSEAFERKVNCNSRGESSGERILEFSESIRRIPEFSESIRRMPESSESIRCIPDNSSKGKPFSSMSDCKTQSPSFQEEKDQEEKDGCCIS